MAEWRGFWVFRITNTFAFGAKDATTQVAFDAAFGVFVAIDFVLKEKLETTAFEGIGTKAIYALGALHQSLFAGIVR